MPGTKKTRARGGAHPRAEARAPVCVVGIGGSAGSLVPLEAFLGAAGRRPSRMSFLVVTHRSADDRGMMVPILSRFTDLQVREATEGARLERAVVYVVPSDRQLGLRDGRIVLRERPSDARGRTPIDALFQALASDCGERAAGVVLSGMGQDGAIGLGAIKERLGLCLVQDPASAEYAAMPSAAVAAGVADAVAEPARLVEFLDRLVFRPGRGEVALGREPRATDPVLEIVRARSGHDFRRYKRSTVERRLERRMSLHRLTEIEAYVRLLRREPLEVERLVADLLISVTRFFRNPEVFVALGEALSGVAEGRGSSDRPVRAWVPGCATGEEAYSLAIVLREHWETRRGDGPLHAQIFATDLDASAIERARKGWYPLSIAADVGAERIARFFVEDAGGYRVKTALREMVVFATHNLTSEPPFTNLDVLSCRNLLIYFELALQKEFLPVLAHALSPGGILLLGTSESIGDPGGLLAAIRPELKIFQRSAVERLPRRADLALRPVADLQRVEAAAPSARRERLPVMIEQMIVDRVAPPVIVVDRGGGLLFSSRRMGRYLEPPTGRPTTSTFAMAREGLGPSLRSLVHKALTLRRKVFVRDVRLRGEGREIVLDLCGFPVEDGAAEGVLVAFMEREPARARSGAKQKAGPAGRARAVATELRQAREQLDVFMRETGDSQEVLQGINEQLESANEELQSTNEELTTSKEEMQSMNEELLSLNAELQSTNEQLVTTNDDMRNLLNSTQIPTLFLDNELRLKRFTVEAGRIARLIPTDVGRPITDLTWSIDHATLAGDVSAVLQTLVSKQAEVTAADGATYTMRIHPYRTLDDLIDGVVVTFVDITTQRRALEKALVEQRQAILALLVERWPGIAFAEEEGSGRVVAVSALAEKLLGYRRGVLATTAAFWAELGAPARGAATAELRRSDGNGIRCGHRALVVAGDEPGSRTVLHAFRRRRGAKP